MTPHVQKIDLDDAQVAEGLALFAAAKRAEQAYNDWVAERCVECGLDVVQQQIVYDAVTGRLTVVSAPRAGENGEADRLPSEAGA